MAEQKRGRGRPTAETAAKLSSLILRKAAGLFLEEGFDGTTMEKVAQACGTDKHTLYRRFPNKAELFSAVYNHEIERLIKPVEMVAGDPTTPPVEALRLLCRSTTLSLLDPDVINISRIAYSQARRFPEFGDLVRRHSNAQFVSPLAALVERAQREGDIAQGDPEIMSQQILNSCFSFAFLNAMLGDKSLVEMPAREAYFDEVWQVLMQMICRRHGRGN